MAGASRNFLLSFVEIRWGRGFFQVNERLNFITSSVWDCNAVHFVIEGNAALQAFKWLIL
jgi:hypothetical protein